MRKNMFFKNFSLNGFHIFGILWSLVI